MSLIKSPSNVVSLSVACLVLPILSWVAGCVAFHKAHMVGGSYAHNELRDLYELMALMCLVLWLISYFAFPFAWKDMLKKKCITQFDYEVMHKFPNLFFLSVVAYLAIPIFSTSRLMNSVMPPVYMGLGVLVVFVYAKATIRVYKNMKAIYKNSK